MLDQVNAALEGYFGKWQALIGARKDARNKEFFERLKPTAVGWKTVDPEEYNRLLQELRPACDVIVEVWMNERWIAKLHLKDRKLTGDMEIIKLMQRRPGSSDAVGLDHVDFLDMELINTTAVLAEENDIHATQERNGEEVWTSLWFEGTEAKLKGYTVIDSVIADLRKVDNNIRGQKFAQQPAEGQGMYAPDIE